MEDEEIKTPTDNKEKLLDVVERLERANAEKARLLEKEEQLAAKKLLGGTIDNVPTQEVVKEESPAEYAKKIAGLR